LQDQFVKYFKATTAQAKASDDGSEEKAASDNGSEEKAAHITMITKMNAVAENEDMYF